MQSFIISFLRFLWFCKDSVWMLHTLIHFLHWVNGWLNDFLTKRHSNSSVIAPSQLAGIGLIVVGSIVLADQDEYTDVFGASNIVALAGTTLGLGCFAFLIGFCGCRGTMKEGVGLLKLVSRIRLRVKFRTWISWHIKGRNPFVSWHSSHKTELAPNQLQHRI